MSPSHATAPTAYVVVGDVMVDQLAPLAGPLEAGRDNPTHVRRELGGQAANSAAWLAAISDDASVHLIGAVGDDDNGMWVESTLTASGVRAHFERMPAPTGQCFVAITPDGERTMFPDPGANTSLGSTFLGRAIHSIRDSPTVPNRLHLHLSGYLVARSPDIADAAISKLNNADCVSIDTPSLRLESGQRQRLFEMLTASHLLFANGEEIAALAGEELRARDRLEESMVANLVAEFRVRSGFSGVVVVKAGSHGAYASSGSHWLHTPAVSTTPIDTTGAGDAFAAGFLAAWTPGPNDETGDASGLQAPLSAGAQVAAQAVSRFGAGPTVGRSSEREGMADASGE